MLKSKEIDVVILCGGKGKRLRKISGHIPKPMVKIGPQPFLDNIMNHMSGFGFRRFILATGYKGDFIKDYYSHRKRWGLKILFSKEKTPLDTGGAVKNARRLIKSNPFFVLNGDTFCEFNPLLFLKFHKQRKSLISVLLKKIPKGADYGNINIDKFLRILSFCEKDFNARNCLINGGAYIFDKDVFSLMPSLRKFSLEKDFFPGVIGKRMFGYPISGFLIDIGKPARYFKAVKYFLKKNDYGRMDR